MDHLDIVKRLCDNDFDTYMVGGGVRDALAGLDPDDFDIVTEATPDKVLELFFDCNVKQVGKSFGVMLVEGYEVATFRHDRYKDSKCIVSFANNIHEDLCRRDFTINSMAYCELTGQLIDNHGGKEDLENRIIKFVGKPLTRIEEDPNRMIRACRFLAKIDGTFDVDTIVALRKNVKKYKIAPERIRLEILKAMKIPKASLFFQSLHLIGMLEQIFPSLNDCWNHEHGPHHIENVFDHCMYTGDSISTYDPILKLTGYLHDVGKPKSFKDNKFVYHEKEGELLLIDELKKLTFSNDEIEKITNLTRLHMNPVQRLSPKSIRKLLKKFDERNVVIEDFIRLRMADRKANLARQSFKISEWKEMYKALKNGVKEELPFNAHSLAYSGGEIIHDFNLDPSSLIGKIQNFLLGIIIEHGIEYNKKEILKKYVKQYLKEIK